MRTQIFIKLMSKYLQLIFTLIIYIPSLKLLATHKWKKKSGRMKSILIEKLYPLRPMLQILPMCVTSFV